MQYGVIWGSGVHLRDWDEGLCAGDIAMLKAQRFKALPYPIDENSPEWAKLIDDPYLELPSFEKTVEDLQHTQEMLKKKSE